MSGPFVITEGKIFSINTDNHILDIHYGEPLQRALINKNGLFEDCMWTRDLCIGQRIRVSCFNDVVSLIEIPHHLTRDWIAVWFIGESLNKQLLKQRLNIKFKDKGRKR